MPVDVLIVGQGLAGSILAWELIQQQFRVMVIDSGDENASQVAAGLINPVTGQRLVKTNDIDDLLPAAMAFYRQLAETFKQQFFTPLPMLRILRSLREQEIAHRRLSDIAYQAFLKNYQMDVSGINSPLGFLEQQQTGYLRTGLLLETMREFLLANASYRQARMDYAEIVFQPNLRWRDLQPKHIVFCEGHHAIQNPWFGKLPFQPVKGQIIRCHTDNAFPEQILNYGNWFIPLDKQHFKVGATFEPGIIDTKPTEQARQRLLQGLIKVCPGLAPIKVIAHQAGIRPATLDKQPFIGPHPRYPNLHVFNGFGAKGSLAIPQCARRFVAALQQKASLPSYCHIQRYDQTYFTV